MNLIKCYISFFVVNNCFRSEHISTLKTFLLLSFSDVFPSLILFQIKKNTRYSKIFSWIRSFCYGNGPWSVENYTWGVLSPHKSPFVLALFSRLYFLKPSFLLFFYNYNQITHFFHSCPVMAFLRLKQELKNNIYHWCFFSIVFPIFRSFYYHFFTRLFTYPSVNNVPKLLSGKTQFFGSATYWKMKRIT